MLDEELTLSLKLVEKLHPNKSKKRGHEPSLEDFWSA